MAPMGGLMGEVLARAQGPCGELVLRRSGDHLEIVCDGAFLVSTENEVSSRALIDAARPALPARPLDVLIGGLGVGHALDEALELADLRSVTVVEIEPAVLDWFRDFGEERARRASADERVEIVIGDVADLVRVGERSYDLVALDTDNGPAWLVRPENEELYSGKGLLAVRAALRPGGVAAFWATGPDAEFAGRLEDAFGNVAFVEATDVIGTRRLTFVVYVCRRD